jgi:glutaminase
MQKVLEQIQKDIKPFLGKGKVANYIPALAKIDPMKFGMCIHTISGQKYHIGDAKENFSIQSISKIFTLSMAMAKEQNSIWHRVGREPSGSKFNSLVQLEVEKGIPRNPFINAGAHVITDIICAHEENPKQAILEFACTTSSNKTVDFDIEVAKSERETGHRNLALGYFLKSFGNIHGKVREVLDVYFHQCSIAMSCADLSKAFLYLANDGVIPATGERIISKKGSDHINALMLTCGMYDSVGDFAYRVGLPSKSGVGGGIVAIVPGQMCITVWSPGLDESGNSLVGGKALELFVNYTGSTIF